MPDLADKPLSAVAQSKTQVESEPVLAGARFLSFAVLTVAMMVAIVVFAHNWVTAAVSSGDPLLALIGTAVVGLAIANPVTRWLLLPRMRRPIPKVAATGLRVAAVTSYVPGSESLDMLEPTLAAMVAMKYPHDCWLLDEGDSQDVKELCRRLSVSHFSRKNRHEYHAQSGPFQTRSKHGNYNAWLTEIGFHQYDVIAAFDPDHVAVPEFLTETLGYFDDQSVAYVQSAQAYYNQSASFIAAGAAEETYDYYSTLQMAGYGMGFPIVIGSHNIHRVSALKDVGGFAPHDADDLLITMFYRARGWAGVYVPAILARGLTPVDWAGYLTQQRRWARSVLDIKFRLQPSLAGSLPQHSKIASYLHGLGYLQPSIMLLLWVFAVLTIVSRGEMPLLIIGINPLAAAAVVSTLTACHFFRQTFYLDPGNEWGFHWRARVLRIAKAPFLLLAGADVLLGRRFEYVMTAKTRQTRQRPILLLLPFGMIAGSIAAAWVVGAALHNAYSPFAHAVAAGFIIACVALAATERMPSPEPFSAALLREQGASQSRISQ